MRIGQKATGKRIVYDEWVEISGTVTEFDRFLADGRPNCIVFVETDDGYKDWFGLDDAKTCPHCGSTNIGNGPGVCYNTSKGGANGST